MLALYSACRVGEKQLIRAAKGDVLRDEGGRTCQRFGLNKFEASLQRLKNIYAHVCVENNTEGGREKKQQVNPSSLGEGISRGCAEEEHFSIAGVPLHPCSTQPALLPALFLACVANRGGSSGPGPCLVLSSKCDSSPDRGIIGNRWLTLLICGLKLQTEFQESSGVINGNRESHTQPNQYVVVVG